jgi:hypothetical protein
MRTDEIHAHQGVSANNGVADTIEMIVVFPAVVPMRFKLMLVVTMHAGWIKAMSIHVVPIAFRPVTAG